MAIDFENKIEIKKLSKKPAIAIETTGKEPETYWFPSVTDLAANYGVSSMRVIRAIEDGRPINSWGVYVDEALEDN